MTNHRMNATDHPFYAVLQAWWKTHGNATEAQVREAIHLSAKMTGIYVTQEGTIEITRGEGAGLPALDVTGWSFHFDDPAGPKPNPRRTAWNIVLDDE